MTLQIPTAEELEAATPDELEALSAALGAERQRRTVRAEYLVAAAAQIQAARDAGAAPTPEDGAAWVQPTGALDAYKLGDIVTHKGVRWASLTTPNVWEPGVSGWRGIAEVDPDTGDSAPPEWVQPTGAHDAYNVGDQVTFEGATYESVLDNNIWSPAAYPAGWKAL